MMNSQPFVFLNPLEKEILEVGSEVAIFWKGGPALPQKVNISLIDIQPGKVIATVVENHIEQIDPGFYSWVIPKTVPLLHDHTYQFYIQDVPRTTWTYGPAFRIN
jgi:hypothetical protein